ncbi:hypothetical protein L1887_51928 [Cichorium endivia]|nr:hypothetical protein L1887_51928 [Cichorium endivia]
MLDASWPVCSASVYPKLISSLAMQSCIFIQCSPTPSGSTLSFPCICISHHVRQLSNTRGELRLGHVFGLEDALRPDVHHLHLAAAHPPRVAAHGSCRPRRVRAAVSRNDPVLQQDQRTLLARHPGLPRTRAARRRRRSGRATVAAGAHHPSARRGALLPQRWARSQRGGRGAAALAQLVRRCTYHRGGTGDRRVGSPTRASILLGLCAALRAARLSHLGGGSAQVARLAPLGGHPQDRTEGSTPAVDAAALHRLLHGARIRERAPQLARVGAQTHQRARAGDGRNGG